MYTFTAGALVTVSVSDPSAHAWWPWTKTSGCLMIVVEGVDGLDRLGLNNQITVKPTRESGLVAKVGPDSVRKVIVPVRYVVDKERFWTRDGVGGINEG